MDSMRQHIHQQETQRGAHVVVQEEEEEEEATLEALVTAPSTTTTSSNPRMILSPENHARALRFRAAAAQVPELDLLSDYWYAQYALVLGDDVESFLDRAFRLQQFREQYDIRDSFEYGCQCLKECLEFFPGVILAYTFTNRDDQYVILFDMAKFDSRKFQKAPQIWLRGAYFLEQIWNCDLEAARRGIILICECDGFDWTQHMDVKNHKKIWCELGLVYPTVFHNIKCFHNGVFWNLLHSLTKRCLPSHITKRVQMGCQFQGGRLDGVYNTPSYEAAQARLWKRLIEPLAMRYQNEKVFSLDR